MLSLIIGTLRRVLKFSVAHTLSDTLLTIYVFSAVFQDLIALENKRYNSSAISVSSFRISFFSMSFIFPPKEPFL